MDNKHVEVISSLINSYYVKFTIVIVMVIPFIYGVIEFYNRFPRAYTWSELIINYQGGFVRRGLLGEIAYQLNDVIKANLFISIISVLFYIIIILFIVFREKINFVTLLFILSPATILFPIHYLNAFARKDIFILVAFVLCIYISDHIYRQYIVLLLATIIYAIAGLIVESAWFYLPMAFALINLSRNDYTMKTQLRVWLFSFLSLLGFFTFILLVNASSFSKDSIIDSWRLLYPDYTWDGSGAVSFLGLSLKEGLLLTFSRVYYRVTLEGYFFAFLLASIPSVCLLLNGKFRTLNKVSIIGVIWAFSIMLCSFAFAIDWGRCIYLFTIHTFLFLIKIIIFPEHTHNNGRILAKSIDDIAFKAILIIMYASSWKVEHWVEAGQSPLKPGLLVISFCKLLTVVFGAIDKV